MTISDERHFLWRGVDQDDNVLDILVQTQRNKQAAKKSFRKLLKGLQYVPPVVITDKLENYGAAKREILPGVEHRQSRYLNNRCENLHRPMCQRERCMQGLKPAGHARRFLSAFGMIFHHFVHDGICCRPRSIATKCELGRDHGYQGGGVRAGSVDIKPDIPLLLSADEIDLDKLTMPSEPEELRDRVIFLPL